MFENGERVRMSVGWGNLDFCCVAADLIGYDV
jgi:hypothetical protein